MSTMFAIASELPLFTPDGPDGSLLGDGQGRIQQVVSLAWWLVSAAMFVWTLINAVKWAAARDEPGRASGARSKFFLTLALTTVVGGAAYWFQVFYNVWD